MTHLKPLSTNAQMNRTPLDSSLVHSPIGKKLLTGLTGLGMVTFVIIHMVGNWLLLWSADRFNQYAHFLDQIKPMVIAVELILVSLVAIHATIGLRIFWGKRQARQDSYQHYQTAGSPSYQSWSSRSMIWTGLCLGGFIFWHLWTFKFGVHYDTQIQGESMRDLSQLVIETFQQPGYVLTYGVLLGGLGFHLRHGIWSAFQSLGLMRPDSQRSMYQIGTGLAISIFIGFMAVPLAIFTGWVS